MQHDKIFCKNVVAQALNLWFNDSSRQQKPIIGDMISAASRVRVPGMMGPFRLRGTTWLVGNGMRIPRTNKGDATKKRPTRTSLPFTEEINPKGYGRPLIWYRWRLPQDELHRLQRMQSES
jgi:hypothetical protein